jgi:hypothetical protein
MRSGRWRGPARNISRQSIRSAPTSPSDLEGEGRVSEFLNAGQDVSPEYLANQLLLDTMRAECADELEAMWMLPQVKDFGGFP